MSIRPRRGDQQVELSDLIGRGRLRIGLAVDSHGPRQPPSLHRIHRRQSGHRRNPRLTCWLDTHLTESDGFARRTEQ
jgi:hypothetical protein